MRKIISIILVLITIIFTIQLIYTKDDTKKDISNTSIGLSTFALYDITKHIVGDTKELFMLMPFGADLHSFEPTPKLIAKMQNASLIIYNGTGLQHWIEEFDFKHNSLDTSKYVKLKKVTSKDEHEHHHGAIDHHYWLDIDNMIKMTKVITKELIKLYPHDRELYIKNEKTYISMLKKLDDDFKQKLSNCKKDTIIVNHNAFSYLSDKYNFHTKSLSGLSPDAQPDAKTMINLINTIKKHNLSTVFFESFASDKAIKSIAKEANVKVDILQPLGNITADEAKKNMTYEDIMRENLKKISTALECK